MVHTRTSNLAAGAIPVTMNDVSPIKIGIVGLGKISQEQHVPAILANSDFEIAFIADREKRAALNVPFFDSVADILKSDIAFDAVALCTSPQPRLELCKFLLPRRPCILLEKPAASTLPEAKQIQQEADRYRAPVFAAWHSRFAPYVDAAREWMATKELRHGKIDWRENVAKWHPGQNWLWEDGGFGVFDPGMNALSILTKIAPRHWRAEEAVLNFPANSKTPSSAKFTLHADNARIATSFEFHDNDEEVWCIHLEATDGSALTLSQGGAAISETCGGDIVRVSPSNEYPALYDHFVHLIRTRQSDCDLQPLEIIEEIFEVATRIDSNPISVSV